MWARTHQLGWTLCYLSVLTACCPVAADGQDEPKSQATAEAATVESLEVQLAYKFEAGQFVHYSVSKRMRYVTRQGDSTFEGLQQSDESKHFRVVSVDDEGNAWLEPVIDKVRMSAKFDVNPPVQFDSEKDKAVPREFETIKGTIGRTLDMLGGFGF